MQNLKSYPYRSRKWFLVIANPIDKGMTHEEIKKRLSTLDILYWCMADELSDGVYHTHVFFFTNRPIGFDSIRPLFFGNHVDLASPSLTCKKARAYVWKQYGEKKKEPNTVIYPFTREQWYKKPYRLKRLYYM